MYPDIEISIRFHPQPQHNAGVWFVACATQFLEKGFLKSCFFLLVSNMRLKPTHMHQWYILRQEYIHQTF